MHWLKCAILAIFPKLANWLDWPYPVSAASISAHRKWLKMVVSASTNQLWTKIAIRSYAWSFAIQIPIHILCNEMGKSGLGHFQVQYHLYYCFLFYEAREIWELSNEWGKNGLGQFQVQYHFYCCLSFLCSQKSLKAQ